jgi:hypothetical protein
MVHTFAEQSGSFGCFWQGVLRTHDTISCILDLNDSIGQIPCADMFERRAEEFSLTSRRNAGNNDDHSGMQRFLSVKSKKIGTVVGDECVVLCADGGHELPVFRTAEPEIIDMICQVTRRVCYFDQGCV